jgi:hypothetical protein
LTFSSGGGLIETNTFLNLAASQDFSSVGLPTAIKASDGMGSWERTGRDRISVLFRKLLFDNSGMNFADLRVSGNLQTNGKTLNAQWNIDAVDAADNVLVPFGPATSFGKRIAPARQSRH